MTTRFDPSLLYAECRCCGRPVLAAGDPDEVLLWMGIPSQHLDADCLLLYETCPNCAPGKPVDEPRFVRLGLRRNARRAAH